MILGIYIFSFVGAGWLLAAYSYQQQLYIGDICNQVQASVVDNNPPALGTGISYYINCFSSVKKNKNNLIVRNHISFTIGFTNRHWISKIRSPKRTL